MTQPLPSNNVARRLLLSLGIVVIGLPASLCLVGAIMAVSNIAISMDMPLLAMAGPLCILPLGMLVLILPILAWRIRANRRMDQAFALVASGGSAYMMSGRQWHGEHLGRRFDAWFQRGPSLELFIACDAGGRFGVGTKNLVAGAFNAAVSRQVVEGLPDAYANLNAYPTDVDWTRAILERPDAIEAFGKLFGDKGGEIRNVRVMPDAVVLHLHRVWFPGITAEHVANWVDGLEGLARAVEAVGPPEQRQEPTPMELTLRTDRSKISRIVWLVTGGIIALTGGFTVVLMIFFGVVLLFAD